MPTQARLSTPVLAGTAIVIGLLVVGGVLLVGRLGTPDATPAPSPQTTPSPTATSTPADPLATPEGAVRAFFAAYADARRTDDPIAVADLVTGPESAAYLSVAGFLEGQKAAGKASVLDVVRLESLESVIKGTSATVTFDYTEGGYDISLADASPLESPLVLPAVHVTAQLRLVGSRWLVDSYESRP
jgi:hypothetical protein